MRSFDLVIVAILMLGTGYSHASIGLSATRIIYKEAQKEASINVNNSGNKDAVIQTWLERDDNDLQPPPFAVTPPLAKIKANQRQLLRVLYQGSGLPHDRESVFWLNVQEIPLAAEGENVLQLAVMQRIKVFYRPVGLTGESHLAPEKMNVSLIGNQLELNNPTPFYINMVGLTKGAVEVKGKMIAPGSRITIPVRNLQPNGKFNFSVVNDFGAVINYVGELKQGVSSPLKLIANS